MENAFSNLDSIPEELREIKETYRNLVERANDGITIIQEGKVKFANGRLVELRGEPLDKIIGAPFVNFVYPDELSDVSDRYNRRMKGEEVPSLYETGLMRKDGSKLYVEINASIITYHGKPADLVIVRDITERKRAEDALRDSESRYRLLFENMLDGFAYCRMLYDDQNLPIDFIYLETNSAFERLTGLKDVVGKRVTEAIPGIKESHAELFDIYSRVALTGKPERFEIEFKPLKVWLSISVYSTERDHFVAVFDNITERKKAEEALRESHQILDGIINAIPVRVFWKDRDLVYLGCNAIFAHDAGFADSKDIIGKDDYQMGWRDQAELYRADDRQVIESGRPKLLIEEPQTTPEGNTIVLLTSKIPLRSSEGEIMGVLGTYMDITERKKAEEALRDSESKLAAIIEFLPDATFVIDNNKTVIAWNRAIEKMTGVNKDNMIGQGGYAYTVPFYGERRWHLLDLIDIDDKDLASKYQYVQRKGSTLYAETYTPALNGGKGAHVWATGAPIFDNQGNRIGAIESIRDITEHKRAERTLREQLNFLQQLIDSIPSPIFYKDTKGVYIGCNKAFEALTGFAKDKIVGHTVYELYPKDLADIYCEADNKLFRNIGAQMYEAAVAQADGSRRDVMFSKATYFDTEGGLAGLVGVILDISERKHMENALRETERRLTDIIEFLPDATVVIDNEGKVIAWNRAMEAMTEIKAQDILGKGDYEYSLPFYGERRPLLIDLVLKPQSEIEKMYSDLELIDGTLVGYAFTPKLRGVGAYLWGVASALYDSKGNIVGAIESIKDITERMRYEKVLKASLQEKEVLLKEIHHRVKNNLQIISSLLNIQSRYVEDKSTADVLKECHNRVRSMALIHENLYRSENLAKVNFTDYISRLVSSLFSSFGVDKRCVSLKLDLDEVFLSIDKAIPCGLIVNELASNCLKHAFPGRRPGEVIVEFKHYDAERVLLTVRDNGVGLPENLEPQESKTMGLKLVNDLAKQIKGDLQLDLSSGTKFEIIFPAE